jgi:hypothetical protein
MASANPCYALLWILVLILFAWPAAIIAAIFFVILMVCFQFLTAHPTRYLKIELFVTILLIQKASH